MGEDVQESQEFSMDAARWGQDGKVEENIAAGNPA
jgi:hypothetical protein